MPIVSGRGFLVQVIASLPG